MIAGHLSGVVTAILLIAFIGGVLWAWSSKRRREFDEAARLPLEEDPGLVDLAQQSRKKDAEDQP
jgi:cytochrome c oxidase cbb3-type subunit 4